MIALINIRMYSGGARKHVPLLCWLVGRLAGRPFIYYAIILYYIILSLLILLLLWYIVIMYIHIYIHMYLAAARVPTRGTHGTGAAWCRAALSLRHATEFAILDLYRTNHVLFTRNLLPPLAQPCSTCSPRPAISCGRPEPSRIEKAVCLACYLKLWMSEVVFCLDALRIYEQGSGFNRALQVRNEVVLGVLSAIQGPPAQMLCLSGWNQVLYD